MATKTIPWAIMMAPEDMERLNQLARDTARNRADVIRALLRLAVAKDVKTLELSGDLLPSAEMSAEGVTAGDA